MLEASNVRNTRALVNSIFYEPMPLNDGLVRELMRVRNLPGAKRAVLKAIRSSINLWGLKKKTEVLDQLRGLSIPLLIVWGEKDRILPVSHAYKAKEALPKAKVHVLERCGHWPQMERAEEFNSILLEFLQGKPKKEKAEL